MHSASRAVFAAICAAMLGLAAGALWMVAELYARHPAPWLGLAFAVALAAAIRHWVQAPGRYAAVLAAMATLLASVYVNVLMAGALIAANMGLGLIDALRTAGFGMLLRLARMGIFATDLGWCLAAVALAAAIASRPVRRTDGNG